MEEGATCEVRRLTARSTRRFSRHGACRASAAPLGPRVTAGVMRTETCTFGSSAAFVREALRCLPILVLALCSCTGDRPKQQRQIGPDIHANLVVVFAPGTSNNEIARFLEDTVQVPRGPGQHDLRPGIASILRVRILDHDGFAVSYWARATQAQRDRVRADALASPVVLKLFEDTIPAEIRAEQLISSGT